MPSRFLFFISILFIGFVSPIQAPASNSFLSFCAKAVGLQFLIGPETPRPEKPLQQTQLSRDKDTILAARALKPNERKKKIYQYAYEILNPNNWYNKTSTYFSNLMAVTVALRVAEQAHADPLVVIPVLVSMLPAHYMADVVAAIYHKWIDCYADESKTATIEFRHHHEFPDNLNETPYTDNVASTARAVALPFVLLAGYSLLGDWNAGAQFAQWKTTIVAFIGAFLFSTMHTMEFHRQAHLKNPNRFFKLLQYMGITLSRKRHLVHHTPPFDDEYGVNNGWSNPLAKKFDLWRRLDRIFWKFRRVMPHNWIQDPRSIPPDVVEDLERDLESVPPDLWEYAKLYPARVPPNLKPTLVKAEVNWRVRLINARRSIYQQQAADDRSAAEAAWVAEQREMRWAYGDSELELFPAQTDDSLQANLKF